MSAVPVQKPIIVTRPKPQLRVEQGVRPAVASKVIAKTALFGVIALSCYFSSSLAGQVMVEKARRDGLRSVERSKAAVKEESLLRQSVLSMTQASAVATWAEQNHFIPPEELVAEAASPESKIENQNSNIQDKEK
jgi:hypothetical protein